MRWWGLIVACLSLSCAVNDGVSEDDDTPAPLSDTGDDATSDGGDPGPTAEDGGDPTGVTGDGDDDTGVGTDGGDATTGEDDGTGSSGDGGDPDFTPDGCLKWTEQVPLQEAVDAHDCVEVQAGTWTLSVGVNVAPGKTLRGVGAEAATLRADPATWTFGCCDAIVSDTLPADPAADPFLVSDLTIDGEGVATYDVCCRGYEARDLVLRDSRCSAFGAVGTGVHVHDTVMTGHAQPTDIPGQGVVTCATGGFGGVAEGAAIYLQANGDDLGAVFENNTIEGSFGPAIDVNGAWGGTFSTNTVSGNTAWAAVSLYGASGWTVADNTISHPPDEPPQPYHPYCATGPAGGHSAGIFLCQDTDANGLTTNDNVIDNNSTSSYYGILSVGADEVAPYLAPRNNSFTGNDVFGSQYGCADDFAPGQWESDTNVWTGNNCGGAPNTGPSYF